MAPGSRTTVEKPPAGPLSRPSSRYGPRKPIRAGLFEPPDLTERLHSVILNIAQTTKQTGECTPKYHKTVCGCGYQIHRIGCRRLNCPACAAVNGKRRARSIRRRLEPALKAGKVPAALGYLVITIPPGARERFAEKKRWRAFVRSVWKLLKTKYNGLYAVECSHITGDPPEGTTPEEWERSKVFHPHVNLLWVAKDGSRPYIPVDKFRQDLRALLDSYDTPVFRNRYFRKTKQVRQKIKYVARAFPGFMGWLGPVRWFGKYPKSVKDEFKGLCAKCGKRLDFFSASNVVEFEEYMGTKDAPDRSPPVDWSTIFEHTRQKYIDVRTKGL